MTHSTVVPGTCLGSSSAHCADENVFVRDSLVYSAVIGTANVLRSHETNTTSIAVKSSGVAVPLVGATVLAQVSKLSRKQAECSIVCVDGVAVRDGYKGVIPAQCIHLSKTVSTTVYEWFRPGDFVRAKVIATGDVKQLILSTAQKDLGVVRIESPDEEMVPISWKYFRGAVTGRIEQRKVAKPPERK